MATTNRQHFETIALVHLRDLYAVALRLSRSPQDAEDLVQEAYLKAYSAWDRFRPDSNCRAWLVRIVTNCFINNYRKKRSHKKFADRPGDEAVDSFYDERTRRRVADPEGVLMQPRLGDEVTHALAELCEPYRVVVVLADVEGLKYKDIAERLGVPAGTVMSRLFRARRQLEGKLAEYAASDYGIARKAA